MNDEAKEISPIIDTQGKGITKQEPAQPPAPAMTTQIDTLISMAINKDLDMDKLERLIAMRDAEERKTAFSQYVVAISNFQAQCPRIPKTGTVTDKHGNKIYNYPKMDKILEVIQPHLDANQLCVRTDSILSEGTIRATCKVSHVGGYTDETTFVVPIEAQMKGGANAGQRAASANSFAKRYAMMNALNLVGSDDDDDAQSLGKDIEYISAEDAAILRDMIEALPNAQPGDEETLSDFLVKGNKSFDELPLNLLGKARKIINNQKAIDAGE